MTSGHSKLELGEVLAAAEDPGGCPAWCIGFDHPEHQEWYAAPSDFGYDFDRCHEGSPVTTEPVRVYLEQYETRENGISQSMSPVIRCLAGDDERLSAAEARQIAAALLNAAELLEEIE